MRSAFKKRATVPGFGPRLPIFLTGGLFQMTGGNSDLISYPTPHKGQAPVPHLFGGAPHLSQFGSLAMNQFLRRHGVGHFSGAESDDLSVLPVAIIRPLHHQGATALKHIGSSVSAFRCIPDGVR